VADDAWSLAEAKAKFSEVVEKALTEGPQHVTRNGRPAVVVVTEAEWLRVSGQGKSFAEVLFDPSVRGLLTDDEAETLFARDPDIGRPIEF
jgi:prevent-host-death family protein